VFTAPWNRMTITPLDSCGNVQLTGDLYDRLRTSENPMIRDVMENYRIWHKSSGCEFDITKTTSVLYDTVAVHLAYTDRYFKMERMGIRITNDGFTAVDPNAQPVDVAINLLDHDGFCGELTDRLLAGG
jgi:inosine-uridine nucleoside N-ribohydrolase